MIEVSARKKEILRHALGLNRREVPYRNRYCPGGEDIAECAALEALGLMISYEIDWIPGPIYSVTDSGKKVAEGGCIVPRICYYIVMQGARCFLRSTSEMKMATQFETCTCSRCGGSGKYSFNMMDGDRCYGCGGTGQVYTKRGRAARVKYEELTTTPIEQIQVGDFVFDSKSAMGKGKWLRVTQIEHDRGTIHIGENYSHTRGPGAMVRHVRNNADRLVAMETALAYQSTLTKEGKVSKKVKA